VSDKSKPSGIAMRLGTIGQLFKSLGTHQRWFLMPLVVVLAVAGLVLSGMTAVEFIVPFIYVVF
jgi:hypothetical protein